MGGVSVTLALPLMLTGAASGLAGEIEHHAGAVTVALPLTVKPPPVK